jgi:hypothetical protein
MVRFTIGNAGGLFNRQSLGLFKIKNISDDQIQTLKSSIKKPIMLYSQYMSQIKKNTEGMLDDEVEKYNYM